jgi:septum formation protein
VSFQNAYAESCSIADEKYKEIEAYVDAGEAMKCAGAFALEGRGGLFVEGIEGCHSNVIGLSLPLLRKMMLELGAAPHEFWVSPAEEL